MNSDDTLHLFYTTDEYDVLLLKRALPFWQQYYFTVELLLMVMVILSKATPICYIICMIKPENYFSLCQKRTTEPYKNNFYKMINMSPFIHQMILYCNSFVHE